MPGRRGRGRSQFYPLREQAFLGIERLNRLVIAQIHGLVVRRAAARATKESVRGTFDTDFAPAHARSRELVDECLRLRQRARSDPLPVKR